VLTDNCNIKEVLTFPLMKDGNEQKKVAKRAQVVAARFSEAQKEDKIVA
jgi:hypothetical protein